MANMEAQLESLAAGLAQLNETVSLLNTTWPEAAGALNSLGDVTLGILPGALDVNNGFTLLSGYLVFFMQAGFAMLSAGSVRAKNAKNIILLNLLDACFGCIGWYITGYAFAFGDPDPLPDGSFPSHNPFIGHRFFAQHGLNRAVGYPPANTNYVHWFFQFTFAATSATIVSGAVAERCKFECYVLYNLILVMFVYPVVAHWVWSPMGWMSATRTPQTASGGYLLLFGSGVYDFAGDGPVHMVGGLASLVGAWVLGPRLGRFDSSGSPVDMPGHNASLTLLGVFLLWFGWYGFNPGSTNAILGSSVGFSGITAAIAVNTTISAAAATISTLLAAMIHNYLSLGVVVWDLIIAGNGALAGLVSITGPCAFVETWAALIIGFIGGLLYYGASKFILLKLKVDDPLDAIAVHAVSGIWGSLGCSAFASQDLVTKWFGPYPGTVDGVRQYGFIMGGSGNLLGAHLVYILVIAAWVVGIMTPFFLLLRKLGLMRVPVEVESLGLDISYHGGSSYPHDRGHSSGWEVPKSGQVFTRDMAERLLEEGFIALEKRLQAQIAAGNGGSSVVHNRKGFAADPEAGLPGVGPGAAAAAAAAAVPAAAFAASMPHGELEMLGLDGLGRYRAGALKPLAEVDEEGEESPSLQGSEAGAAGDGTTALHGGESLSVLQQRMQQAYGGGAENGAAQ